MIEWENAILNGIKYYLMSFRLFSQLILFLRYIKNQKSPSKLNLLKNSHLNKTKQKKNQFMCQCFALRLILRTL